MITSNQPVPQLSHLRRELAGFPPINPSLVTGISLLVAGQSVRKTPKIFQSSIIPLFTMTSKHQDWADISDDEEEESVPTIQLDSVDLSSLSLSDKSKATPAGKTFLSASLTSAESTTTVKSLADRISQDETTPEKKEANTEMPSKTELERKDTDTIPDTNLIATKYEVTVKLQDMQADPTSPLYSVKSFEELGLYKSCVFYLM
jgi:hypothetical protein